MGEHLSRDSETQLGHAVAAAMAALGLQPRLATELLYGPEGASLHIKMYLNRDIDHETRRHVVLATTDAALDSLPELTAMPHVTVMRAP